MRCVTGRSAEDRGAAQHGVILHQHAVVKCRHARGTCQPAIGGETRRDEHDVVGLPFTRRPAGIHQRRLLLVDGRRLAVHVGLVVPGIEDLQFVEAHEIDPAVTPALAGSHDLRGCAEFQVELDVTECDLRALVAGLGIGDDDHRSVLDFPAGFTGPHRFPGVEILAVEEYDGIGRHASGGCGDHCRHGRPLFGGLGGRQFLGSHDTCKQQADQHREMQWQRAHNEAKMHWLLRKTSAPAGGTRVDLQLFPPVSVLAMVDQGPTTTRYMPGGSRSPRWRVFTR